MTNSALLAKLFNLSQHTDTWNSAEAARDFWILAAVVLCLAVGATILITNHRQAARPR
jgi:hypothetical protein